MRAVGTTAVLPAVPGVLLCLCGPMTDGGLHRVAIISPDGYYRLEHASFSVLQTPFAHAELSDAASATVHRLLECPEYCCFYGNLEGSGGYLESTREDLGRNERQKWERGEKECALCTFSARSSQSTQC